MAWNCHHPGRPKRCADPEVAQGLADGAALAIVLLLLDAGRPAKANLSLDAGLIAAIDEVAAARSTPIADGDVGDSGGRKDRLPRHRRPRTQARGQAEGRIDGRTRDSDESSFSPNNGR